MTLLRIRDETLEAASYPPASHHSELSLLQGYGAPVAAPVRADRVVEAQGCACGGVIDPGLASEIPASVAAHNATSRHQAWQIRTGRR